MTPFESYVMFTALKFHFTQQKYDYFKYSGKVKVSQEKFECRKDRFMFARLCKKYKDDDLKEFFIANIICGKAWIGQLMEDEANDNYLDYLKYKQAFSHLFDDELHTLFDQATNPSDVFKIDGGQYPIVINSYLSRKLSLQSLSVMNKYFDFAPKFDTKLGSDDVLWSRVRLLIIKLHPFLTYDQTKVKESIKRAISINT